MSCFFFFFLLTYLHAQTGLGACKGQHLDFHPLTFADHICHICHSAFSSKLRDMNQALPAFPITHIKVYTSDDNKGFPEKQNHKSRHETQRESQNYS